MRRLVSKAITTDGQVIDVFTAAGLPKPDISILSDQFLAKVRAASSKDRSRQIAPTPDLATLVQAHHRAELAPR